MPDNVLFILGACSQLLLWWNAHMFMGYRAKMRWWSRIFVDSSRFFVDISRFFVDSTSPLTCHPKLILYAAVIRVIFEEKNALLNDRDGGEEGHHLHTSVMFEKKRHKECWCPIQIAMLCGQCNMLSNSRYLWSNIGIFISAIHSFRNAVWDWFVDKP